MCQSMIDLRGVVRVQYYFQPLWKIDEGQKKQMVGLSGIFHSTVPRV